MARSPLMDALLRSLRAARAPDEALTRREALRAAAGAAGAAVLGGCATAPSTEADAPAPRTGGPRVVIVGAGIAGVHCARRLRAMGVVAEVREASGRTGGRMLTDHHTFGPLSCELGGEFVDSNHWTMFDLAQELGLEMLNFWADDPSLAPWTAFVGGRRLSGEELREGLVLVVAKFWGPPPARDIGRLDRMSVAEWLDGTGLAGDLRRYVEAACAAACGLEAGDASALHLVEVIAAAQGGSPVKGADRRFRFRAGSEIVVERMARDLDPGQVRLASRLVRVRRDPDGRLRLTFDRGTVLGSEEVLADHAVVAIPFTLLREVEIDLEMDPRKRRAIAELGVGTHARIAAGFKERAWRARGSAGGVLTDLPFQCAFDASRMQEGREGILANLVGGRRGIEVGSGPASVRAQEFVDGIDRVFPGVGDACDRRAVRMHWPSHPWAMGSVSAWRVGQATDFGGREIERVGSLHFCGEHTSKEFRGTMEGGALTGAMAALEVAEDLGIEVPAGNPILDRARKAR